MQIYNSYSAQGRRPLYYGGGTEIISMSRVFNLKPDAVIDIKSIPECRGIGTDGTKLSFGAAATLNDIKRSELFPLLSLAAGRIADHTIQCRLTLGGNLSGTIIYRETLMPLLLADAQVELADSGGIKTVPAALALADGKRPKDGELLMRVIVDEPTAKLPCFHIKKSKTEKIGYPLVTLCALFTGEALRLAASGLCTYPFRFADINVKGGLVADIATQLVNELPAPVLNDLEGSSAYRTFIFQKTTEMILHESLGCRGNMNA